MSKLDFKIEKALRKRKYRKRKKLRALLTAALAIPGLGLSAVSHAQSIPDAPQIWVQYGNYRDFQAQKEARMRVNEPMLLYDVPVEQKADFQGSFVVDTMSGASPFYFSTLSGASGVGIHDSRYAADGKVTRYFDNFSFGIGGTVSKENDYFSRGIVIDARVWTPDKNTVVSFGVNPQGDHVTSTNDPMLDEVREDQSYLLGVTQVLDQNSIGQSNVTYEHNGGYLSDPYKIFDNRPENRDRYAWLNRYVQYIPWAEASFHADYRLYFDSWGVTSHTIALAWYQPVGAGWMVRPDIRYYTQSRAEFFDNVYPPQTQGMLYTADQRLGDFGGITTGLKITKDIGHGVTLDGIFEVMDQRPNFKLGGHESSPIDAFYAMWFVFGLTKTF